MNVFNNIIKSYSIVNNDKKLEKVKDEIQVTYMKIEDISNYSSKIYLRKMSNEYSTNFNNNNFLIDDIFTEYSYLIILIHNHIDVLIYGINLNANSKYVLLFNKCFNEYISSSTLFRKDYSSLICYSDNISKNNLKYSSNYEDKDKDINNENEKEKLKM